MLILAGITISLTLGQRGILNRAQEAGRNYQEAAKREDEELANFLKEADDIINGINGGETTPTAPEDALAKKVQIGDYVAYDPTAGITEEEKEAGKLSYTSPVGTGSSHGNGYTDILKGQTFTVEENTKWRVLSKDEKTGEVVLISEKPMHEFGIRGAIGYLYYEQELNEICKIYGYGTGANISKTFTYETGDLENKVADENGTLVPERTKGTITGSGARSITVEDINNITKYDPTTFTYENKGTTYKYGDLNTHTTFYPTKTKENGKSETATKRTIKWTQYSYQGSQYLTNRESVMYKILFGNDDLLYWVASRGVTSLLNQAGFGMFGVSKGGVFCNGGLCLGRSDYLGEDSSVLPVRPIVYLNQNLQTSGKDASGAWIISE